jgi:hypothetical protein
MSKKTFILVFISLIICLSSCKNQQDLSAFHHAKIDMKASPPPEILAQSEAVSVSKTQQNEPVQTTSPDKIILVASTNGNFIVENKTLLKTQKINDLIKDIEIKTAKGENRKLNFMEKIVVKKSLKNVQKKMATTAGWDEWDGNLKIGAILIALAVVLSIINVGKTVPLLAALAGLVFVVIGLMNTY